MTRGQRATEVGRAMPHRLVDVGRNDLHGALDGLSARVVETHGMVSLRCQLRDAGAHAAGLQKHSCAPILSPHRSEKRGARLCANAAKPST